MKITKNLPIYLLSASLLFVGVTSISQAQGATSTSSQIRALQKQVKTLNSDLKASLGLVNFAEMQLGDRITALENKPGSLSMPKTVDLTYVTSTTGVALCPLVANGFGYTLDLATRYNADEFRVCTVKVLIP